MSITQRLHARCLCSAGAAPFALAGTTRTYERARPFDVTHLALDLTLDLTAKSVSGTAALDIRRVSPTDHTLELDAIGFELRRVRIDTGAGYSDVPHDYDGDVLRVSVPPRIERARIEVDYRAVPLRGLYFLSPDEDVPDRPEQVWSQCQDEDARHWMPCHDKPHVKMTSELRVRAPAGFTVLSNGELNFSDTPQGDGPWVYHFKLDQPHPSYLMTLVAGRFDTVEDRAAQVGGREVPVAYLVPPGRKADAKRSFGETPRMIELFSRLTGVDYPWSRYSQVVVSDFIFGGMENTTATTMYEYVLLDERAAIDISSNDLIAHELAHQWFGDYVTCRDWSHGWLNEGFATYMEHVEREDRLGRDEYDWGVEADLAAYLSEASGRYQRPIVCRDYAAPIDLFDRHLYEKGGLVLHMLRRELGDELFWKGIGEYLRRHAHGIVETNDLARALESVSGKSLERFFDEWVYRPGHPALKLKVSWDDGQLTVSAKQTQKTGNTAVFALPLEVDVADAAGRIRRYKKRVTTASDALVIALPERPAWAAVDPDLRLLGDVTLEAPADLLKAQLADAPLARSRWQAARALAKRQDLPTTEALAQCLAKDEEAWMVRVEAARSLAKIRGEHAVQALVDATRTEHPKVRRAAAAGLGNFRDARAAKALGKLTKKELSYLVESEAARALGKTRHKSAREKLLPLLERSSWGDITRAGALEGLAALRDEEQLPEIFRHTRYGVPVRARRAAISAAASLSDSRKTREQLEDLLDDRDPHLRIDVVNALSSLGDTKSRGALSRQLRRELDGRVARRIREALRDIGDAGAGDRRRLNDELETLKHELSELKLRFTKLENGKGKKDEPPAAPLTPEVDDAPRPRERKGATPEKRRVKRATKARAKTITTSPSAKKTASRKKKKKKATGAGASEPQKPTRTRRAPRRTPHKRRGSK